MALKPKVNFFGNLTAEGWQVASTADNRTVGSAEAVGPEGFTVAVTTFGEQLAPQCDYVVSGKKAALSGIVLGSVNQLTINNTQKSFMLGGLTCTTQAGQMPTLTIQGRQVETSATAGCTCTLSAIELDSLAHAQTFGIFSVTDGQLNQSTLQVETQVAVAEKDYEVLASDLTNGRVTVTGTIVNVDDSGQLSEPTITINSPLPGCLGQGVITQQTVENPNGDYETTSFTLTFPLKKDA